MVSLIIRKKSDKESLFQGDGLRGNYFSLGPFFRLCPNYVLYLYSENELCVVYS